MVAMCALYALPNIYGEDHAVQISAGRDAVVTDATVEQVKAALSEKNISPKRVEFENEQILVRVSDSDTQLVTRETLEKALGDDYYVISTRKERRYSRNEHIYVKTQRND